MTTFTNYNAEEAKQIAGEFVQAARAIYQMPPREVHKDTVLWTEWVLDWWAARKNPSFLADARRLRLSSKSKQEYSDEIRDTFGWGRLQQRSTFGEFLLDLTHSNFPRYDDVNWRSLDYWSKSYPVASDQKRSIHLALESEFGKSKAPGATIHAVMEDATKLLVVNATVKVMIFASTREHDDAQTNSDRIFELGHRLVLADATPFQAWLWIDLPWGGGGVRGKLLSRPNNQIEVTDIGASL